MDAGHLDQRIDILQATTAPDAMNEPVETWSTLATVWAQVVPVMDSEKWASGQTLADQTLRFTIRWAYWISAIGPKNRITYSGRTYDVQGVKDLGRKGYREITATSRAE
jgi:SPP1 family predicted phage head-tail adaptor